MHWHGLRLENQYDGVPDETQVPIPIGGTYTCKVRFPDAGFYWYHPHIREDFGLEMGLYGTIVVEPADPSYWPAADRQLTLTLDDLLVEDGHIAPFSRSGPTFVAMGRYGNVMLINGETRFSGAAAAGEVVRLYVVNTANTRIFNFAIRGARAKLVGGDSGRYERETFTGEVLLAPSERAVLDVLFDTPGAGAAGAPHPRSHLRPRRVHRHRRRARRGRRVVRDAAHRPRAHRRASGNRPRHRTGAGQGARVLLADAAAVRGRRHAGIRVRLPDASRGHRRRTGDLPQCGMKLVAVAVTYACPMHPRVTAAEPGVCPDCGMKLVPGDAPLVHAAQPGQGEAHGGHDHGDGLEWEDLMPDINRVSDSGNMIWQLIDRETGAVNGDISWSFTVGDRVKIRLVNEMDSDHPMHHPFHVHGAGRFLVLSRDGKPEANLVWKDTVLLRAGETVDILLDVSNPGLWMAHCHIAEHNQSGMMFSFSVARDPEQAR